MEEADVNEAQRELRYQQLEEMAIHIYVIWREHQFQETVSYWMVHEGYALNHDEDRIVRDLIAQKIRLERARYRSMNRPKWVDKFRAVMAMHILRPEEIFELVNGHIITNRQAVLGQEKYFIFLRNVVGGILGSLLFIGIIIMSILAKDWIWLLLDATMFTFLIRSIANIIESSKQLMVVPGRDIQNVTIPWDIQNAIDQMNQEEQHIIDTINAIHETSHRQIHERMFTYDTYTSYRVEDVFPTPIPPPPFNLVFQEEGGGGNRIRGIPPCFFCNHASPHLEFTANAELKDLTLCCEEDNTMIWDGERFFWYALRTLNHEDTPSPLDIRHHQDCCRFAPNLRIWQDTHLIKTGEFEII